jgi:hypothetical protein
MKKQTAKRIAALCAALLLLPSVASCSPAPDTVSDDAGVSRLVTTEYPWTEALTPHVIGDYAPEISVITSRDSLIDYVSIWEKCYDFVDDSVTSTFYDVVTGCGGSIDDTNKDRLKGGWGLDFALSSTNKDGKSKFLIQFSMPLHNFLNDGFLGQEGMKRKVGYIALTERICL